MATQIKYQQQAEMLEAIRSGGFDVATQTKYETKLSELLNVFEYEANSTMGWFKKFSFEFDNGISKRGRVRSACTKDIGARRFLELVKFFQAEGLDKMPPATITPEDIKKHLMRWAKFPRTKKAMYADLRQFFNWLLKQKGSGVTYNPCHNVEIPHYVVQKTEKITDKTLLPRLFLMIKHCPRKGTLKDAERQRALDMALLSFAISTAARRTAIASIRLSRINWSESTVNYDDKGKLGIISPINDCQQYLQAYLKTRKLHGQRPGESRTDYLTRCNDYNRLWLDRQVNPDAPEADDFFFRRHDGLPCSNAFISATFTRWSRWLSDPKKGIVVKIRPHQIRKYRGILAYQQTKDINHVMNLMNHSSINMTLEYLEITSDERMAFLNNTSPLAGMIQA